jgi:3-phenylpropionate/cinnamic acid dioxygenase small subunit
MSLFTEDGKYWMPVSEEQQVADGVPNIFYEDMDLMRVRAKRVTHPRAWSQKPPHRTSHVVSNVVVESLDPKTGDAVVNSRFYMVEFRRDALRHFSGKYTHHLKKTPTGYAIKLQRVDLVNGDGTWDYVIQTWV